MSEHPFVVFVRKLPCSVHPYGKQTTPTEPDHHPTIGSQGEYHTHVWPLCSECHKERHRIGLETFERKYGVSARGCIAYLEEWFDRLTSAQISQVTGLSVRVVERRLGRETHRAAA